MISVLIDGYFINKPRGLGRYVQELIYSLTNYADGVQVNIAIPYNTKIEHYNWNGKVKYHYLPSVPFPVWEQIFLPFLAKNLDPDIVHFPYNTKPLIYNLISHPHVVTLHDVMFLDSKHTVKGIYQKIGNFYRKVIVKNMRGSHQTIVTVSNHSALEIKEKLNQSSLVVYTSSSFLINHAHVEKKRLIEQPYLFHVGGISPHKNTRRCIEAFIQSNLRSYSLVVSGVPKDSDLVKEYESDNIYFTGWINDHQMLNLYMNAQAVVFPSLREGYGLPIIEAFACNTPIITSNLDPMKEISGDAAILVDPYDIADIASAIIRVASNDKLRSELIRKGQQRIQEISPKIMADKMMSIYRSVLE